jgi:hypothetical protein
MYWSSWLNQGRKGAQMSGEVRNPSQHEPITYHMQVLWRSSVKTKYPHCETKCNHQWRHLRLRIFNWQQSVYLSYEAPTTDNSDSSRHVQIQHVLSRYHAAFNNNTKTYHLYSKSNLDLSLYIMSISTTLPVWISCTNPESRSPKMPEPVAAAFCDQKNF